MKAILSAAILVMLAILICGCTTAPPTGENAPTAPKIPHLLGNWSGKMTGYVDGQGFTDYSGTQITMMVTGQKDRIFTGKFVYTELTWKPTSFAGVISPDGKTLTIAEQEGGYSYGTFIGPDEIDLVYVDNAKPFNVAIDSLRRD
jgi:hypothetical protein